MNKKLLFVGLCLCLFFNKRNAHATTHCTGLDISFASVTLTGVGTGQITYHVTIKNAGTQTILFNKLTLKNFVSTDNTLDGSDVSGGSALFSAFASGTSVLAGQEYTTTYYSNYSGDIKSIPYLILQLTYQDAECDATNNQVAVCTRPNAVFNSLTVRNISANEADFDFEIQNTGGDTLFLASLVLQSYVSTDHVHDGGDPAAGGSILSFAGKQYLLANEMYSESYGAYQTSISSYAYVISDLEYSYTECSTSDNEQIQPLVVVTANQQATLDATSQAILWDMSSRSFITKVNNNILWSGTLTYQLFDTSGRLLTTGKTIPGERVYLQQGSGLSVLVVADDQHVYSQKILHQ